jgi:hypothetical protein
MEVGFTFNPATGARAERIAQEHHHQHM